MTNKEIADVLNEVAVLMELKGENPFRCRAYQNAARQVETLDRDAKDLLEAGGLSGVRGIGKGIAEDIAELVETGGLGLYEKLKASIPAGLIEMLGISGLGPKRVRTLHETLGIETVSGLEAACREDRVSGLAGFGAKTQANLLAGIEALRRNLGFHLFCDAMAAAEEIHAGLKRHPSILKIEIAGALRRRKETTKDIDLVASAKDAGALMEAFAGLADVASVTARGETKTSVVLKSGIRADLRVVAEAEFPYALHHFTGSREHNTLMRGRAKGMGLKMNEYGLFRGDHLIRCQDEAEVFEALSLSYIPPELREGTDEIEAAERGELPRLVAPEDLKGVLHVHTNASDGSDTLEAMARAAQERGYAYVAICDHSRSLAVANGLSVERLRRQGEEIDRLNQKLKGITILKGVESDILPDGGLDYDDDALAGLDVVVASIHSQMKMSAEKATERLVRAVRNPHTTILGHATGRLLLMREGYPIQVEKVLDATAACGVAVEFNANPRRMDLDWRHLKAAKERGVKVAINSDAHSVAEIDYMVLSTGTARKGWLTREDVLNAMTVREFVKYLHNRRERKNK